MDSPQGGNAASSSTFQLSISSLGAVKLKDAVKAKLSEFMGSYTDDVLAEYVVVLVGHGKRQSQAIADLEAFLGDQSKTFVAWLWEHLASNQASYVDQPSPSADQVTGKGSTANREEQAYSKRGESGKVFPSVIETISTAAPTPVMDSKESNEKDLMRVVVGSEGLTGSSKRPRGENHSSRGGNGEIPSEEEQVKEHLRHADVKRNRSPEPWSRRGRGRMEERQSSKRDSPPEVRAPRRLLESAVRDAVAPGGSSSRRTESGFKRLRSVVAADVDISDTPVEANGRQQAKPRLELTTKGTKVSPAVVVALKAAAAAAEDVNNSSVKTSKTVRVTSSVWDRLGNRNSERSGLRSAEMEELERPDVDTAEDRDTGWVGSKHGVPEEDRLDKRPKWRKASERLGRGPGDAEEARVSQSEMASTAVKDHLKSKKQIDNIWPASGISSQLSFEDRRRNEEDTEGVGSHEDRRVFRFQSSKGLTGSAQRRHRFNQQDSPAPQSKTSTSSLETGKTSEKILDTNTRNQELENGDAGTDLRGELAKSSPEKTAPSISAAVESDDVLEMKKRMRQVQLEMTKLRAKQAEVTKEVQKVASAPGTGPKAPRSQEEINAHSVCVSNIHFAATKEAIVAHFSPCGEIVRVTILMDPATGKPKGSAYIEFALKEGVESAMNMNDSSLLSRTLKVIRKDAALDVVSPASTSRPPNGIPFVPPRGPPVGSFLRGIPPMVRRPPPLARPFTGSSHLQWKRETSTSSPGVSGNSNVSQSTGSTPTTPVGRAAPLRSPNASMMGDRYGHGPIRMTRSLSYVRPAPYTPRQTAPTVQEQKVAN
ncbi:hypothetical protein R1sor_012906 [Riccia sorocarpa]|uniref:RRM domain-containing protein n=1 Tax=Riccia sorocarpa TaxID=122646 RepID=A0ABD3I8Q7_9MARC